MEVKIAVRWLTEDPEAIAHIRKYFKLPSYTTVNGWTPGTLRKADREMFEECARRGFFNFMEVDWTYNGATYSW